MIIGRVLYTYIFATSILLLNLLADAAAKTVSSFTPLQKGDFWLSEGGNYTFGFKDVGNAAYLLSIWHSADPNQTAIWWADFADDPVVKDGASFNYTGMGMLQLYNADSMLVWSSSNSSSSSSALEFQDTGNLILLKDNNQVLWQSFEVGRRSDSLMLVELARNGSSLRSRGRLLQSRRNSSSYAGGRFHVATDETMILTLYGLDPSNNEFVYSRGRLQISKGMISVGKSSYNRTLPSDRLALDYDGNLRVYSWQFNVSSWQVVWEFIHSTKCKLGSPCGPFGICSLDGSHGDAVSCSCPPGYHARVVGDDTQGCSSNTGFSPSCGSESSGYNTTIVEVPRAAYDFNDLVKGGFKHVDLEQCKTICLQNCSCIAAVYSRASSSGNRCYIKGNGTTGSLMNGCSTDANHTLLIKVVSPIEALDGRKGGTKWLNIGVGVAATVVLISGIGGCARLLWQRRRGGARAFWTRGEKNIFDVVSDAGLVRFTYQDLVKATENFRHPLGEGGFGAVYKGWVRGKRVAGSTFNQEPPVVVAVKVLKGSATGKAERGKKRMRGDRVSEVEKQFRAEVNTLGKIHHVNLVSLLGYCASTDGRAGHKWLLVYEYMEKSSLDCWFMSAGRMQQPLPWPIRYSIALGTARGIAYLHHDCNPRILHCDIKPQNVLLDQDFIAKVADFGLAKRFLQQESLHLTMSNQCGTRGYMAPELLKSGAEITGKVDVYSFGMLLLELVNGLNTGNDHMTLIEWAVRCISAGVLLPLQALYFSASAGRAPAQSDDNGGSVHTTHSFDPSQQDDHSNGNLSRVHAINSSTGQEDNEQEEMEKLRVLKVALWCVQRTPSKRPLMSCVVQLIDATVAVEDPPDPTLFPSSLLTKPSTVTSNPLSVPIVSPR